jgi:hypothetical protein
MSTAAIQAYYDKYFPDVTQEGKFSENHLLTIWLTEEVTREQLEGLGFVMEDDDKDIDGDFVVEDGQCLIQLLLPIEADAPVGGDELPDGWEEEVPELIGLNPEWVEDVTMDG